VSEPGQALRELVAREHGLPEEAASFLTGGTLEEIEISAGALLALLSSRPEPAKPEPPTNIFAAAAAEKQARQRALVEMLHGKPSPSRDERGRFVSAGFDGGARQSVPAHESPERAHGKLVAELARLSAIGRSDF
jgi:hypothetical protein